MLGFAGIRPDPLVIVATLLAFIVGTTIHEFCHAWSALMLGDDTAQRQGRITLNPLMHFDPIGFLGMVLISIGLFGIGWGRPVPVNPNRLRGHQRGMALTAAAGPISNIVLAALFAIPLRFGNLDLSHNALVFLQAMVWVNLLLASFNLIPIPPLDGSKVIGPFLPVNLRHRLYAIEPWGFIIIYLLFVWGGLGRILAQAAFWTYRLLV